MIPTDLDGAFHAIIDAVRSGEIPESRIDESVRKVLRMKALVGLHKNRFVDLEHVAELVAKPEDMQFAQDVADEAITLVRENGHVLPLREVKRKLHGAHRMATRRKTFIDCCTTG